MIRRAESAAADLRRNDPAIKRIRIVLQNETSDADLAQALEQNPFVTLIDTDMTNVPNANSDWGALLRVIAARETLESVTLRRVDIVAAHRDAPPTLVRAFLQSIQQNNSIRYVRLVSLRLPTEISSFVEDTTTVKTLALWNCSFSPSQREHATRDLSSAMQRNTSITLLLLGLSNEDCAIPILHGLQSNVILKRLSISGNLSDGTAHAMHQLLESSTSIAQFDFTSVTFSGEMFRPVAQSLIQSPMVCALVFHFCQFRNEESTVLFRSILQEKRNLASLGLHLCTFEGGQVHDAIISSLSRPDAPLQKLEIENFRLGSMFPNIQFENLLRAVEKSRLERFAIGKILSHQQLQTLTQRIPSMRVQQLQVDIHRDFDGEEYARGELLFAVKDNFRLRSVKSGIFNRDDKERLLIYAD